MTFAENSNKDIAGQNASLLKHSRPLGDSGLRRLSFGFHDSFEELETEWQELERNAYCSPFQRISWMRPQFQYAEQIGSSSSRVSAMPLLVSGRIESKLVLILPLLIEEGFFTKRIKWLGSESSDYNGMILDREFAANKPQDLFKQITEEVIGNVAGLDALYLSRNPSSGSATNEVLSGSLAGWHDEHASHSLQLSSDWKKRYSEIRSGKSRQRLRSKLNAFKKSGQIEFKQVRGAQGRLDAARQILDWKIDHLMKLGRRNPFGSREFPSETRLAIESSMNDLTDGSLKVFGLYRDKELVAGMLAFVDDEVFYYVVSAYSPDIPSKFSVGTQLLVKTLEFASRAGLDKYDFLIGDEAYKFDWCDTSVPLVDYIVPFSVKGYLYGCGVKIGQRARKFVRQSSLLDGFARQLIIAIRHDDYYQTPGTPDTVSSPTPELESSHKNRSDAEVVPSGAFVEKVS